MTKVSTLIKHKEGWLIIKNLIINKHDELTMKNIRASIIKLLVVSITCIISNYAFAHHSFVSHYDPSRSVELTGVVTKFSFRNPHAFVFLDAENEQGEMKSWEVELHSKAVLSRMGLNQSNLKAGDTITATVWPNREEGNPLVFGIGLVIADGTKIGEHPELVAKESVYLTETGAARAQGRWRSPLVRTKDRISPLPLNEAGISARESYSAEKSPANDCEIINLPTIYHVPYLFDITISDDSILLAYEIFGINRRIPIGDTYEQSEETGMLGVARARIEGDEIVIESKNFPVSDWGIAQAGDYNGRGADVPSSPAKTLVERLSVSDDGMTLNIAYELGDSAYLSEVYSNTAIGERVSDDETIYPFECDIESASRFTQ